MASPDPEPAEALALDFDREELIEGMQRLAPIHREVLDLVFFHGLSYGETADALGLPVGTVRSRLSNAKRGLRSLLDPPEEMEG